MIWRDEETLSGERVYVCRKPGSLIPAAKVLWLGRGRWAILHANGGTAVKGTLDYAKAEARRMLAL